MTTDVLARRFFAETGRQFFFAPGVHACAWEDNQCTVLLAG